MENREHSELEDKRQMDHSACICHGSKIFYIEPTYEKFEIVAMDIPESDFNKMDQEKLEVFPEHIYLPKEINRELVYGHQQPECSKL